MRSRNALLALAVSVVLAPLAGCAGEGTDREPSSSGGGTPAAEAAAAEVPTPPTESRPPAPGEGSEDPDDINGDGHRDLVVPVSVSEDPEDAGSDERVGVVYGSADGLDPETRSVYGRGDLGLPDAADETSAPDSVSANSVVTADLDGDGFPDFVTTVVGEEAVDESPDGVEIHASRTVPYVTWGGPGGPTAGDGATPVRLPDSVTELGVESASVVRGDFDGDGNHDLAAKAQNESSLVLLYGPFTRSGEPARTDTSLPWSEGELYADDIDPTGEPRATSLLLHHMSDGEQSGNTLYQAAPGTGPSADGRELRPGNAHAFGDFDGDGLRDVAIGDDGSRNNEPGYETEPPDVDGSLAVYPGSGGQPVTHELPEAPEGAATDYGPGGYFAADPDGDGRDGILVATYEGATLIDGEERTPVLREGPASVDGEEVPAKWRHARPAGAADFDGDEADELILHWAFDTLFGYYGEHPTHWWITDGTTSRDKTTFATTGFASPAS
jgi:hypothetical protein